MARRLDHVLARIGSRERIFRQIYEKNLWSDPESASGPGSTVARTSAFSAELPPLFASLGIKTLLDAPCGDANWIQHVPLGITQYIGVDIVAELVDDNQRRLGGPSTSFRRLDLVVDDLPQADIILCRDGLVHLSNRDVLAALSNFARSGAQYLLATTFTSVARNRNTPTGWFRPINLERPPFSFPPAIQIIDERRLSQDGTWSSKCLGLWRLESLPYRDR